VQYGLGFRFVGICELCREQDLIPQRCHAHFFPVAAIHGPFQHVLVFSRISLQKEAPVSSVPWLEETEIFSQQEGPFAVALEWKESGHSSGTVLSTSSYKHH